MADDKKNLHKGYVHYIPAVEEKDDWDKDLTFVLIRSLDELSVHDVEHDFTAWDTETSGLDPDMDYLVGFSFSFDGETGYYVPVAHDDMALGTEAVEIFYSILKKTRKTQFLFNCRFDQRFLEAALKHKGWTLDGMPYYDVQNAIWLADTNVVMPSLKASARHFLGWKPKTFDETLGDAVTFQHVPAEDAYFYACTDALMTYQLAIVSNKFYRENLPASRFDNNMLYPLMRLENTPQRLDTEYLKSLVPQVEAIIERTREEVYRLAGTQFNLNAPQQFGKILVERFGVDTGARTATGAMKADLKTIDAWMVKHSSAIGQDIKDFIKAYKEYKKTVKFKSSYLDKYIKAASDQDIYPVRFSYKTNSVPCLTENNTVLVKGKGFISIKDVTQGDMIWTAWGYRRVLWNKDHDVNKVYRVTLQNGMTIEGTDRHPVLVRKAPLESVNPRGMTKDDVEWAGLCDLKNGEPVIINHTCASSSCDNGKLCILARIMGYFYGKGRNTDGCLFTLRFIRGNSSSYYRELLVSLFGEKYVSRYDVDSKCVEYNVSRHVLSQLLEKFDLIPEIQTDSHGNRKVDNVSVYVRVAHARSILHDTFRHFLCGYLDSKGTSLAAYNVKDVPENWVDGIHKDRVVFIIPSKERDLIVSMLWAASIGCDVTEHSFQAWFGECKLTRIDIHEPYALSNLKDLWSDFDPLTERFSSIRFPKQMRLYLESKVVNVEVVDGEVKVYDIEVEDVHEYVANGIVTHNTGRLSCGTSAKNKFFTNNNVQCLEENTSVITSEGIKPIKHVNTGDLVWTGSAFVPCVQLGSKQKRCETVWTYFGKITASLEHKFYTLNLYTFELEWDELAYAIAQGKPIVRNVGDGGFTLRELLENEMFHKSMLLKPELSEERIKELEELYKDVRFDMIRKADNFWYPNIIPPEVTVYDLCVPTYERFTANGFIVHNSTPKPHAVMLKGRKATEQEITEKKDILGWYFSNDIPDDDAKGLVEGMDPDNLNIRRAFLPENDQCYVVSIDMCLEGGSPVQTKRGYMGVCEMKPGDEVWSPQGWVTVERVMRTGVEKVIKVFPDNGGQAIYCTENHPFVINGEKVKAKDIVGKVPSVPFHAYVKESVERNKVIECLSCLKQCRTIKEASHYVLEHDLKLLIEDALVTYTRAEVAKWCGIRVSSFGHFMNDLGIQPTGKSFRYSQSKFYNNVFVGESTPTSAYLFGFILGDGNISRRRGDYLTLNISSKDEAHLRQICNIFGEDLKIRHNTKRGCEWWTLDIPSRDICNRLLELGISERKSTEPSYVNFEWLGDNFRHFIRGLFDADGYVRITSVLDFSFVGHDSYITEIQKRLEGQWGYKHTPSLSYLSLHGTVEQRKFIYAYLYHEATIWLQRKRDIIESWYQDKFGGLVFPVWNCTVDTTEHQLYVQCAKVHQCAEELRVVANLYHEDTWINAFNSGADVHKACYSPDTEFYVKSHGWMYAENITPEMEIAYYDVRSDSFKFTKADKRATQKGRDVYVRSGVFNVTGNHRMYVNFDTQGYHIERADNLKNCGNAKQRFHMKTAVGTRVEFSKERNKDNATAFALGFLSSIDKEFDGTRMIVKCSTLYPEVFQILKDYACNSTNKTLFEFSDKGVSYLTSLGFSTSLGRVVDDAQILTSRKSYRGFICGLLHGLACRKDSEICLGDGYDLHGRTYVKDKALADWIQWHLTCNGYSCRVHHNVISDRYALYIESRQNKDVCMTFHSVTGHILTNGGIYSCFEVPSGLLVTRYDGRITVNGNTAIKLFGEENYTKDARKKAKCLSGDTMVHTVDGRSIQIRNLVSEETHMNAVEGNPVDIRYKEIKISTPDGWSDVTHWIYNGFRETLKIIIDRRLMLEVTPDHLVGKYEPDAHEEGSKKYILVRADSLSEGDLVLWDYCPMRVTSIQKGYSDVYDITVDNVSHTFHANGVVVHNCASFGILYGSGAQGFNNSFPDMTLDECREFMKKFKDALPAISQGQAENIAYARQHGDINTGFGRHRRVKFWLSSQDRAKQAFGERTTKNCYSPDTEYMTKDGWKVAADIEPTTQLAYYNPDTGVIRYCDAGIRYTHVCTESMKFSSRTADWDVTTNHRMWIRSTSHDRWRPCEAGSLENLTVWQEICSADLCSSLVETSDLPTPLGTFSRMHLARLFAWVLTDSTITEKEHYIICTQNKPQNFSVIEEIFSKFGAKVTVRNCVQASSGKEMVAYLAKPEFCEWVLGQIGGRLKPERHVPAWVFNSSKEVREEFLRHLVLADGTPNKKSKKHGCAFYSANKALVDDVQILFTMTGFRASLQTYHNANGTEVYRLNCVKTSVRSMDNRIRKSGNKQLTRVKHEPIEYSCFSVPTQILVTRHHGKVTFGMNTAVQGTAADVLKIIFCRLWEKVFKPYPQVKFMSTIHDEVNFSIPIELAREVIPVCIECMTIEREDWPVPLKCSLSLSRTDLGSLIPFTYDAATDTYEPEWDTLEVKPKVTHNVETKVVDTGNESLSDDCVCGVSLDEIDF